MGRFLLSGHNIDPAVTPIYRSQAGGGGGFDFEIQESNLGTQIGMMWAAEGTAPPATFPAILYQWINPVFTVLDNTSYQCNGWQNTGGEVLPGWETEGGVEIPSGWAVSTVDSGLSAPPVTNMHLPRAFRSFPPASGDFLQGTFLIHTGGGAFPPGPNTEYFITFRMSYL